MVAGLILQVGDLDGGQVAAEHLPALAAVGRDERAEVGAEIERRSASAGSSRMTFTDPAGMLAAMLVNVLPKSVDL